MCGICGEFIFSGSPRVDRRVLESMRDVMTHRGPDDAGSWTNQTATVGLGHRRLSIVDLSPAGHQPMSNEDGSVWIVFNGEIYNHAQLRPALEKKGHRYRSHSDTETIIHLYEEEGIDCVRKLDGMFAFAIWDSNRNQLCLARDRLGKKPLYYWRDNDRIVFASEIKSLLRHPAVPRRPDPTAVYHYLTLSAAPAPLTLFAGIRKLHPAETMTIADGGKTATQTFWNPFNGSPDVAKMSEEECAAKLLELLKKSIAKRMMSDVPFGVFLSGGVDSSTNVALMSQLMTRPVDTFSVALEGDEVSNEFSWARKVANHFKCAHHEIVVPPDKFLGFVEELPYYQDEPLADPVCVPLYFVSKLARDNGVIVVQVGEGSDEIFAGYNGYRDVLEREAWANKWRRWVPGIAQRGAVKLAPHKTADFLRRLRDGEEIFWGGAIGFYEMEKQAMLRPEFVRTAGVTSTWPVIAEMYRTARALGGDVDFLHQMIFVELRHRLAELLLMRVDKMSMATSVEARVPFLDIDLVEFAMRLPTHYKVRDGVGKYILKKAVRPILPEGVVDRAKQGFCGSATNMLQEKMQNQLSEEIRSSQFLSELIQPQALADIAANRGPVTTSFQLWNLWNLALWHRRWFN